jgi:hypothetical protein
VCTRDRQTRTREIIECHQCSILFRKEDSKDALDTQIENKQGNKNEHFSTFSFQLNFHFSSLSFDKTVPLTYGVLALSNSNSS